MIRTLLTTTALTAMLVGGAYAQDANAPAKTPPSAGQTQAAPASTDKAQTSGYMVQDTDHMASKIIGMKVYNSADKNAKDIGDVNDLVVTKDGKVAAIVVGVGGFLGVGEKNVALDWSAVQWTTGADGSSRLVASATKDQLNAAPAFKAPEEKAGSNANGNASSAGAMTSGNSANAPAANAPAANPPAANPPAASAPAANPPATNPPAATTNNNANAAANANKPEVDVSKLSPVAANSLKTSDLKGIDVVNPQGDIVGQIGDFVLNKDGKVDAVIVDFGGFLGIGQKEVALGLDNLQFEADQNGKRYLVANVTKDEVQKQPTYNKNDYQQNRDKERLVVKGGDTGK